MQTDQLLWIQDLNTVQDRKYTIYCFLCALGPISLLNA
jgi:hypothetical protein